MYLDFIQIKNFRPYYGEQKINFGFDDQRNLTIILADNNSGKSSLVNALTWCLYGEELHDVRDKNQPLFNELAAKEQEENDEDSQMKRVSVEVKIRFYDLVEQEDGELKKEYFTINRIKKFQKWLNQDWEPALNSYLRVNDLEGDEAQIEIDKRIPKEMFQYFFFNGADLSNYFEKGSGLTLKESIRDISQIDLIQSAHKHFKGCLDDFNAEYKKLNPDGINYADLIKEATINRTNLKNKLREAKNKLDIAETNINKLSDKLRNVGSKDIDDLIDEKNRLKKSKKELKRSIDNNTKKYEKLILDLFPIAVVFDELVKAIEVQDEAKKNGIPEIIQKDLLNDIIKKGRCICGVKLDEHPECLEELEKRLNDTSNVNNEEFYKHYYNIKSVLKRLYKLNDIDDLRKEISSSKNALILTKSNLDNIDKQLKESDVKNVKVHQEQLEKNEKEKIKYINLINGLNSKIKKAEENIAQYKIEKAKNEDNAIKQNEISKKQDITEKAFEATSDLESKVGEYIRNKINEKTKEQFTSIKWAYENKYTDVSIDKNYKLKITEGNGNIRGPGDLSDGAENLLALSFMMALHSIQGFEIPLIIDAPFEKLDKTRRLEFIDGLHEYTADKQIIFLFTDSQFTDDVKGHMSKHISDEYKLIPGKGKKEIKNVK